MRALMRLVDIKLAIPTILLALVLVLALGQTFLIIVVILAIAVWPRFARNVRGEVLQLKTMDYVALAKVAGASTPRILAMHIFPGVDQHPDHPGQPGGRHCHPVRIDSQLPRCWSAAAYPGLGVNGGRWPGPA